MQRNRLFQTGIIVLAVGAIASAVGGWGEIAYIRCVAASPSQCDVTGAQYVTDFLANADILSVGMNIVFVGIVIAVAGIITGHIVRLADGLKPSTVTISSCPKCGVQVARTAKFCDNCGNKLGE